MICIRRTSCFALALFAALSIVGAAHAADWPQWRGPNRNGHSPETGLLKEWPKDGPTLAWKATGIGGGFSSVAVVGDRIYTTGDKDGESTVFCLDASQKGKIVWSRPLGPTKRVDREGTRSTPTVDGDRLYAMDQGGTLACLATADGKVIWSKNLAKDFGGRMMSGWGYSESALVDGDVVLVTPGGKQGTVLALNKMTGQLAWQTTDFTDAAAYASLVPATIGGVKQYLQLTDKSVAGIAPDGKVLWRADRSGRTAVIPDPVCKDDVVFVTSGYGVGGHGFRVTGAGGTFKAEQIYDVPKFDVHHGGGILVGDHVYGSADGDGFTCMAIKDGKIAWQDKASGKGSVTYADGLFYFRDEKGPLVLIEATPQGYKEKGRFNQPDRSSKSAWPHPAIAGGKLYIRDQDVLLCFDVQAK